MRGKRAGRPIPSAAQVLTSSTTASTRRCCSRRSTPCSVRHNRTLPVPRGDPCFSGRLPGLEVALGEAPVPVGIADKKEAGDAALAAEDHASGARLALGSALLLARHCV